jgi:hypothetical protein
MRPVDTRVKTGDDTAMRCSVADEEEALTANLVGPHGNLTSRGERFMFHLRVTLTPVLLLGFITVGPSGWECELGITPIFVEPERR